MAALTFVPLNKAGTLLTSSIERSVSKNATTVLWCSGMVNLPPSPLIVPAGKRRIRGDRLSNLVPGNGKVQQVDGYSRNCFFRMIAAENERQ